MAAHSGSDPSTRGPFVQREGSGEPLVLLHGITGSRGMWRNVVPLLAAKHDVIVPTALGHRGGTAASIKPARIAHVVDDAERLLDRLGLAQVHLAGNSMGGWVALELARRGRAASVCALSPAGMWESRAPATVRVLGSLAFLARLSRPVLPLLAHSALFRRIVLRDNAVHGHRVTREELIALTDDVIGCTITSDLLRTPESLPALAASCPITIAWAEKDRIFPLPSHAELARHRIPGAHYLELRGVGHVPMFDDPQLVADTILASTARASTAQPTPDQPGA
ncbi:MAG: alpha/beta hydrolase [Polyangiales bacterium]